MSDTTEPIMSRQVILEACQSFVDGEITTVEDVEEIVVAIEHHGLMTDPDVYPSYFKLLAWLERNRMN